MQVQTKGTLIALTGALVFTPDALLVRLAATDPFTLATVRSVAAAGTMLAGMGILFGRDTLPAFLRLGYWGLIAGVVQGVSMVLFCLAISNTSAANALLIFASMPLFAALLGWAVLGERVATATWLAIAAAMGGIAIVAGGSLGGTLRGDLLALANAVSSAIFYVIVRYRRDVNFIPANILGYLIGALIAAPFAEPGHLQGEQWMWLLVAGLIMMPGAIALLTLAIRYLPAAEVALIALLEVVLGPLLVWLALGEAIPATTIVGGAVLLAALIVHMGSQALRPRGEADIRLA